MAQPVDDRTRKVVPRWRPFRVASEMGALRPARTARDPDTISPAAGEIEGLLADWNRDRNAVHAASLVDAAVVLGRPDLAEEAAVFLAREGRISDLSLRMARSILGDESSPVELPPDLSVETRYRRIAEYRRSLRRWPNNPLLWVDMAREYSSLGHLSAADRALTVAIGLAPLDRHVLRSASRFYLHARDPQRAHSILLGSPSTPEDPWLLAAEIVTAGVLGRSSRLTRKATRMVESNQFHPRHVSELAGALGTLELEAGNRRGVRRLFGRALLDPTENSVAQAGWVSRHMSEFELPTGTLSVPRAFEARAWEAALDEDYTGALKLAWQWLRDEPFATRSALFGSWIASNASADFEGATSLLNAARLANPHDPRLLANLFYCRASVGDTEEARKILPELESAVRSSQGVGISAEWEVTLAADRGLLAFRSGNPTEGRRLYDEALKVAREHSLREIYAMALLNFIREEVRLNPATSIDFDDLNKAVGVFPRAGRGVVRAFLRQIPSIRLPEALVDTGRGGDRG